MQKVEGSSPFSRSSKAPLARGFRFRRVNRARTGPPLRVPRSPRWRTGVPVRSLPHVTACAAGAQAAIAVSRRASRPAVAKAHVVNQPRGLARRVAAVGDGDTEQVTRAPDQAAV